MSSSPRPDPGSPTPDPTELEPWGARRMEGSARFLTSLTRAVPPVAGIKQLALPLRRLARRKLHGMVDDRLWGHRLRFQATGNISEGRLLFMPDSWDRTERAVIRDFAEPGAVMVDVGANFGAYTWWLLHLLGPRCRILALEPEPALNRRLRFNLATNGWDNVEVVAVAAGDREGTATLHIHGANQGENTLADPETGHAPAAGGGAVEVPVRPLARIVADAGLDRVDILKIDIEGLEPPVLTRFFHDAPASLWPRLLLCEFRDTPAYQELERLLDDRG
ncbi:MAG: FkbM family methyltransferase, partial [Gemmatimonadota bacterium]